MALRWSGGGTYRVVPTGRATPENMSAAVAHVQTGEHGMTKNTDIYKTQLQPFEYSLNVRIAKCALSIEQRPVDPFAYLFRTAPFGGCCPELAIDKLFPQIIRWWGLAALHHLLWLRRQTMIRVVSEDDMGEMSELVRAIKQFVFEFEDEFHESSSELPEKLLTELQAVTPIFRDRYFCAHPSGHDLNMASTALQQTLKLRILSDVLLAVRTMRAINDKMRASPYL